MNHFWWRFFLITLTGLPVRLAGYDALYEQAPVDYSRTTPRGLVARLQERLDAGLVRIEHAGEQDFLRDLLAALQVPVESQVLVFSKTSHQNPHISPATPRAIYFGDDVYAGWVQGGVIEVADHSPGLGLTFHVLDHRDRDKRLRFERTASCLDCHAGSRVGNLPGVMVRSVYPDHNGQPLLAQGSFLTGHASPLAERWGGWYVTGRHGAARHMGNTLARETKEGLQFDTPAGANRLDLSPYFNTRPYLRPGSDIVALLVLEHQVEMHNILAHAATYARLALHRQSALRRELGEPPTDEPTGSALSVTRNQAEKILRHLLFRDEFTWPDGGIQGDPEFQTAFQRTAKRDGAGRSLKDFQLKDRLFRYRCSYMIYSAAFADLPAPLKSMVLDRLLEVLDGRDRSGEFAYLTSFQRESIKDILRDTLPDLPAAWGTPSHK